MFTTKEIAIRPRGTPASRPMFIWAMTGQTLPGMYFPKLFDEVDAGSDGQRGG